MSCLHMLAVVASDSGRVAGIQGEINVSAPLGACCSCIVTTLNTASVQRIQEGWHPELSISLPSLLQELPGSFQSAMRSFGRTQNSSQGTAVN
uniref:Uncharacterized protein n=1 Tax=Oryza punctata TaxID=4537 RepID=A0A0E0K9B5_ORYPU